MTSQRDEIALQALDVARSYVVALKESKGKGGNESFAYSLARDILAKATSAKNGAAD